MRRTLSLALVLTPLPLLLLAADAPTAVDFEDAEVGKAPAAFTTALTGKGAEGTWVVTEDPSSPAGPRVLAQTSADKTSARYPLCVHDAFTARDATVSVRFRALSGEVDQAGGVVLRYRDNGHYYMARANALEDNVRFYKYVDGKRIQLAGVDTEVSLNDWHTLTVVARGSQFEIHFDGRKLFYVTDETFKDPGKAGLWTKADSVTHFDDLQLTSHDAAAAR